MDGAPRCPLCMCRDCFLQVRCSVSFPMMWMQESTYHFLVESSTFHPRFCFNGPCVTHSALGPGGVEVHGTPSTPASGVSPSDMAEDHRAMPMSSDKGVAGAVGTPRSGFLGLLGILEPHPSSCPHFSQTQGAAFTTARRPARAWPRRRRGKEGINRCLKRPERSQMRQGTSGGKKGGKSAGTEGLHVPPGIRKQ